MNATPALRDDTPWPARTPCSHVDPFIGTAGDGHAHPAASAPFGMVQAGPDTGRRSWACCSGYQHGDAHVLGYSQNRLSGTGCPDLGDVQFLPFAGARETAPVSRAIDKRTEKAMPGYYSVVQPDDQLLVEIAATHRAAIYRMTSESAQELKIRLDLNAQINADWGEFKTLRADVATADARQIHGDLLKTGWIENRAVSFALEFDRPWLSCETLPRKPGEGAPVFLLTFPEGKELHAKVGLSITSAKAARRNLLEEIPAWDFDGAFATTRIAWEQLLGRATVNGDERTCRNWYTALYRLYLQPMNYADSGEEPFYTTLSLWDTFRAAQPWYTLQVPEIVPPIINSLLRLWRENGKLPVMSHGGKDIDCMVGNHAVPVIVDAYLKGFPGVDWQEAFRAIDDTLSTTHPGKPREDWEIYDRHGYYPCDLIESESVSRTLECGYDDGCAERLARALGHHDRADFYAKRAKYWRNLFDPQTKFVRAKDSKGRWHEPFDPFQTGHFSPCPNPHAEANAWQCRFHLLQASWPLDVVSAYGGAESFAAALDATFETPFPENSASDVDAVAGLIGQYAHGNGQSHHVAYLYQYVDRGERTAERVREIFQTCYQPAPEGLPGNDDCGQMSAWHLFSALGFYPVDPCGGRYVLGAPQVSAARLKVRGGLFSMRAENFSEENKYVESVRLNGRRHDSMFLHHGDVVAGGELVFKMTSHPPERAKATSSPVSVPGPEQDRSLRQHVGIPSFAISPRNGRMWATWYAGCRPWEDENNYCVLATSGDDGRTWKEVLVADPDGPGPRRTFDPELWIAPDGRLRWFWTDRPASVCRADSDTDNRAGWRNPSLDSLWQLELSAEDEPSSNLPTARYVAEGVMMCKPIALESGDWLYPIAQWRKNESALVYATKDGRRFERRGGASLTEWWLRDGDEHSIVELSDGRLWMLIRNFGDLRESYSIDGGKTWSRPVVPPTLRNAPARLFCAKLDNGHLLLVKHGPIDQNVGRIDLTAYVSLDDGRTWEGGLLLDDRSGCSYPDGQQDARGRIHIVYDRNRLTDKEIVLATFTEADVLAGKLVSEGSKLRRIVTSPDSPRSR
ncbi:MAG: GH92 family glycosyl hydrolase [Kiritimatiellia bacterium]